MPKNLRPSASTAFAVGGGALIVGGLGWWVLQVTLLDASERSNVSGYGQLVLATAGVLFTLWQVWKPRVGSGRSPVHGLTGLGRLLPAEVRDECCEEWAAWMADLRADGTPRVRRWLELLSLVLIVVPRLAIGLRWAAVRRAVDR